jgi:hypothetical protein
MGLKAMLPTLHALGLVLAVLPDPSAGIDAAALTPPPVLQQEPETRKVLSGDRKSTSKQATRSRKAGGGGSKAKKNRKQSKSGGSEAKKKRTKTQNKKKKGASAPQPAPLPPLDGDFAALPGDRVPDECVKCDDHSWEELDLRHGGGSVAGRDVPSGGGLGASAGGGAVLASNGGGTGSSSGAGGFGVSVGSAGSHAGLGATGASASTALARGGDSIRVDLNRHLPPAGDSVKGGMNQGGLKSVQDAFAGLSGQGGLLRLNLRMNREEDASWAAWQMRWAQEAGLEVLLTVYGTPQGMSLGAGSGGGSAGSGTPGGQPDWARSVPNDLAAWSQAVIGRIQEMRDESGALPDYVEVWNEPDRPEFFHGSVEDYLAIYEALAPRVVAQLPGVKVGGPGLAGSESPMDGEQSVLLALVHRAAERDLPLDFVSWHSYGIGAMMRYTRMPERLRAALDAAGRDAELLVTEWNIRPTNAKRGWEFDQSAAAANFVTLLSSAVAQGVDGNVFFMLYDTDDQEGIADLSGKGLGALTARGIKKPVYRAMELVYPMASEQRFGVQLPRDEYALGVLATTDGQRARLVLANDVVEPDWVWSRGCREAGLEPGTTAGMVARAGGSTTQPPTRRALIMEGLSPADADLVLRIIDRTAEAADLLEQERTVEVELDGAVSPQVLRAWVLDSAHNAPAAHREDLLPHLEAAETAARASAQEAAEQTALALGATVEAGVEWTGTLAALASALGLSHEDTARVVEVYQATLRRDRVASADLLNSLPGAALTEQSAAEAGVTVTGNVLTVTLEPNAVVVLDLNS